MFHSDTDLAVVVEDRTGGCTVSLHLGPDGSGMLRRLAAARSESLESAAYRVLRYGLGGLRCRLRWGRAMRNRTQIGPFATPQNDVLDSSGVEFPVGGGMMASRMRLSTPEAARGSLAGVMRRFHTEKDADPVRFRSLVHSFGTLLSYFKHELDVTALADLRARVELLEDHAGVADLKRRLDTLEGSP